MADFVKYQALGNDYLVIDPQYTDLPCTPENVRRLCDRHLGVGADGVLHGPLAPVRSGEPVPLTTVNSDGTACARSANGVRMFALYLAERYLPEDRFIVRTPAGNSPVRITDAESGLVSVSMGRPSLAATVTLTAEGREFETTCLDNGNPHAVIFEEHVSPELAHRYGPSIAGHVRFPERTNVQFVQVLDRTALRIEIWERGAGYTLASGASGCAAASAAAAVGAVNQAVTVHMPGGQLEVLVDGNGQVTMSSVVEQVMRGCLAPALRNRLVTTGHTAGPLG